MKSKLLKIFFWFRKIFTISKVNMQRSMSYVSILNSGMILFLLLAKLQDYGIKIYITKWFFPIFILSMLLMMLVGYIDFKSGFHREEVRVTSSRNPYFKEIIERLERLEKEVKQNKK